MPRTAAEGFQEGIGAHAKLPKAPSVDIRAVRLNHPRLHNYAHPSASASLARMPRHGTAVRYERASGKIHILA